MLDVEGVLAMSSVLDVECVRRRTAPCCTDQEIQKKLCTCWEISSSPYFHLFLLRSSINLKSSSKVRLKMPGSSRVPAML